MLIPNEIIKCVVFIGIRLPSGELSYRGTGFFVTREHDEKGTSWRFAYLVTAKHVADAVDGNGGEFYVRINVKNTGKASDIPISGAKWYRHPSDPDADVAMMPITVRQEFDALCLSSTMLASGRKLYDLGIGVGDEVFLMGLFSKLKGRNRNTPVSRTGNIAMFPDQKVSVSDHQGQRKEIDALLIETRSIGGLSGSPVVARQTVHLGGFFKAETNEPLRVLAYGTDYYLIGLVSAHWDIDPDDINNPNPRIVNTKTAPGINWGFAVVVPAAKISEIIECEALQGVRRDEIEGVINAPKDFAAIMDLPTEEDEARAMVSGKPSFIVQESE